MICLFVLSVVYVGIVRLILEYNSIIWSPSLIRDIEQTEKVQRHFTKWLLVFGMRHLTSTHMHIYSSLVYLDLSYGACISTFCFVTE